MPKKFKLDISNSQAPGLIGILTDETDLKLSWIINKKLKIKLSRDEDLTWLSKELPNPLGFPVYTDTNSRYGIVRLIKNRSLEGLWIKGYKLVDYLFILADDPEEIDKNKLIRLLQEISEIRGAYPLDPGHLQAWME